MNFYRQTIKNLPPIFEVPDEFQNRDVEVILLPLDRNGHGEAVAIERDAMGYPIGFFEQTAGALADDPIERPPQGEFEVREEIR
ncbi:MAG: hypothetical protein ABL999_09720 [Pyrinomonadaceae bacterium]